MNVFALGSSFLMGLFGGVHCLVMCGGIVGVLCAGLEPRARARVRLRYLLAYNAGRIATYAAIGTLAGALGASTTARLTFHSAQIGVRLLAALTMIAAGLYLAGVLRSFARIEDAGRPLWRLVEPLRKRIGVVRSPAHALALGAIWGLLPCGMVYAAAALALFAGSAVSGGATMLAFGLGTLPALLVAGALAEGVRISRIPHIRQTAGLLVALSGSVHLLLTGMQAGWLPAWAGSERPACCASRDIPH
jgi:sulfite exporter TauE/SafE